MVLLMTQVTSINEQRQLATIQNNQDSRYGIVNYKQNQTREPVNNTLLRWSQNIAVGNMSLRNCYNFPEKQVKVVRIPWSDKTGSLS